MKQTAETKDNKNDQVLLGELLTKRDRAHKRTAYLMLETLPVLLVPALIAAFLGGLWANSLAVYPVCLIDPVTTGLENTDYNITIPEECRLQVPFWPKLAALSVSFVLSWIYILWRFKGMVKRNSNLQSDIKVLRDKLGLEEPGDTYADDSERSFS